MRAYDRSLSSKFAVRKDDNIFTITSLNGEREYLSFDSNTKIVPDDNQLAEDIERTIYCDFRGDKANLQSVSDCWISVNQFLDSQLIAYYRGNGFLRILKPRRHVLMQQVYKMCLQEGCILREAVVARLPGIKAIRIADSRKSLFSVEFLNGTILYQNYTTMTFATDQNESVRWKYNGLRIFFDLDTGDFLSSSIFFKNKKRKNSLKILY